MFVQINDVTYRIKFHRNDNMTFAELYRVEESGHLVYTAIDGVAICNPKDNFDKGMGRKVALADLLDNMVSVFLTVANHQITKEDRRGIWEEYFRTHNK